MEQKQLPSGVLLISSFPPRECGLATYTEDLVNALTRQFDPTFKVRICALAETNQSRAYDQRVTYTLNSQDAEACATLAKQINADDTIQLICLQHEFGLFGGQYGDHVLALLCTLEKPVVTCFHTVLPSPDAKRRQLVQSIAKLSEKVIVMTSRAADILQETYEINAAKLSVIKHGMHLTEWKNKASLKKQFGVNDRVVLSTFGLLSPHKSLETGIEAMAQIRKRFPNALYLILGRTHPSVITSEGERYRQSLEAKVAELGLHEHVRFVNKYLELDELLDYLTLTDIYLFTSKDPDQAVSGTFTYALGCACPVISTPIGHAKAMLTKDVGMFFDFSDADQLTQAACLLLGNDELRQRMSLNAYYQTRDSIWENVAIAYADLFKTCLPSIRELIFSLPLATLKHIDRLSNAFALIHRSHISAPDLQSGYTLDDNAQALLTAVMHYVQSQEPQAIRLAGRYLHFINYCQQPDGSFVTHLDAGRQIEKQDKTESAEDATGRAIWALGVVLAHHQDLPGGLVREAEGVLERSWPAILNLRSPQAMAFAIKGLYYASRKAEDGQYYDQIVTFAHKLTGLYHTAADGQRNWYGPYLTYANSVLPEAMLLAFQATGNELYKTIAIQSFDFLLSQVFVDNRMQLIAGTGWHLKSILHNSHSEQSLEAGYIILALDTFHRFTGNAAYTHYMQLAFSWYLGNNRLRQIMYNPVSGGCFDGLEAYAVNQNQGAESTLCYLMARLVMDKYQKSEANNNLSSKTQVRRQSQVKLS